MERNDHEYYRRRERDERARAARAADMTARHAHLTMAERYAERVQAIQPLPPQA